MPSSDVARFRNEMHDAFFEDRDQELIDFLQEEAEAAEKHEDERMQEQAGVRDPDILAELKRNGISSASMTAFMLLPLVRLAWADTKIQQGEFEFILQAAEKDGIEFGTPAYRLLTRWLEERPSDKILNAWRNYAHALARELDEKTLNAFRTATLQRTERVAKAAGGILGLGEKISENERRVLDDITNILQK